MNELERIIREASSLAEPALLATVVRVEGSSYRRPGARMLATGTRWISGCVSGGCLEGDVMLRGAHRCASGPVVVTYDSTREDGEPWTVGLGCNGIVDVLLEPIAIGTENDALAFARACFASETSGRLVTVIRSTTPGASVGARVARGPSVALARPVEDPEVRAALGRAASGPPGIVEVGGVTALVEEIAPSPQLFVLGSGHDVAPIVTLAQSVGFRVTVADRAIREPARMLGADRVVATDGDADTLAELIAAAREAYVVIMHHQETADRAALAVALASGARYVGVLGPARRTRSLVRDVGGSNDDPRLHAPIGLDIGAETPEQIALAIVGELHAIARGASGGLLRGRERALHAEVAFVVLAAGGSTRLGQPKQLVEIDGETLVRRAVAACLATCAGPVAVVLGAGSVAVDAAVGDLPVARVFNDDWKTGMASSIRAGVRWAQSTPANALVIVLVDQLRIGATHLLALRDAWLAGAPIAASRWDEVVGAPALFDRGRWEALAGLEGDHGANALLRSPEVVAIDCPLGALDIDTPIDIARLASPRI